MGKGRVHSSCRRRTSRGLRAAWALARHPPAGSAPAPHPEPSVTRAVRLMRTLDTSPDGAEALERRSSPAWFGRSVRDRAEQNTAPTRPAQPRLQVVLAMGRGVGGCFQTDHLTGHSPPESFARAMASLATGCARAASPVLRAHPVACPAGAPRLPAAAAVRSRTHTPR